MTIRCGGGVWVYGAGETLAGEIFQFVEKVIPSTRKRKESSEKWGVCRLGLDVPDVKSFVDNWTIALRISDMLGERGWEPYASNFAGGEIHLRLCRESDN